jgi:hypothetical protein
MSIDITLRLSEQSAKAVADLQKQGLRVPAQPEDRLPRLPNDITSLHDENLMVLFTEITSWLDYVAVQVACAEIDERALQRSLDYAEAGALIGGWSGDRADRVSIARAKQAVAPEVQRIQAEFAEAHNYRKLIQTLAQNLERDSALVSRELTRRTSGSTPSRRAMRYV